MQKKLSLNWSIYHNQIDCEARYCHNCGSKVIFKDSLKRRQNANGKNIFYFAIYKCPSGHTWNKQINTFKAVPGLQNIYESPSPIESQYQELNISVLIENGINEVEILLDHLQQKMRLDKFLSLKIKDMSRAKIVKLIDTDFIRINGAETTSKTNLKEKDIITLLLSNLQGTEPAN